MENQLHKSTGISLALSSLLITATMVLHPAGGSIEYIIGISESLMASHSLAIFSLPIMLFGFYGLTIQLLDKSKTSVLAFIIMAFGLIAAMFAALMNGLVLPGFLTLYKGEIEQNISILDVVAKYNFAINTALDYVFIAACCLAIAIYSVLIIRSRSVQKWIGYFGLLIIVFAFLGIISGFAFTSLIGFRMFVFGLAGWILAAGILLFKSK